MKKTDFSIRQASVKDASRLAEILIFTKRIYYRDIFCNDEVSFGEMQVLPLAQEYIADRTKLQDIWVYEEKVIKGMLHVGGGEIRELYVDAFFQNQGIGGQLIRFAMEEQNAWYLWVLEKNIRAVKFYQAHGFLLTDERRPEPGTRECVVRMVRSDIVQKA